MDKNTDNKVKEIISSLVDSGDAFFYDYEGKILQVDRKSDWFEKLLNSEIKVSINFDNIDSKRLIIAMEK